MNRITKGLAAMTLMFGASLAIPASADAQVFQRWTDSYNHRTSRTWGIGPAGYHSTYVDDWQENHLRETRGPGFHHRHAWGQRDTIRIDRRFHAPRPFYFGP